MGSLEGTYDTKLHEAVRYGDIEEVKSALQQGYDANLIGLYQWSALHEAAYNGEEEILQILLKHKGDPNKADLLRGCTAVHYAAREGHVTCLQLLIKSGGSCDIRNKDGNSALDISADECQDFLKTLISESESPEEIFPQEEDKDLKLDLKCPDSPEVTSLSGASVTDSQSELDSPSSTDTRTDSKKNPVLGYIHLSFEYHAKKKSLKIRVWQLSDLLLPPPNSSMIHSVYIKSFLMPDKKKDSKRKTEEIRVESSDTHLHIKKGHNHEGIHHVYSPSTFKFSKPLEYSDISKEMVKDKSVQLEVCITQRYSKRSFLIGLYHMPLKTAIRKIVRDQYPLIPCVNPTIPINMKVYNASQLQITNSAKIFYSNPNLRNTSLSNISNGSDRAVSDPDFFGGISDDPSISPSTSITLNEISDDDENSEHTNKNVRKLKSIKFVDDLTSDSKETRVAVPEDYVIKHLSESKSPNSVVDMTSSGLELKSDMSLSAFAKTGSKSNTEAFKPLSKNGKHCKVNLDDAEETESYCNIGKNRHNGTKMVSKDQEEASAMGGNSRPETPTWDYYDMELNAVEIPLEEINPSTDQDGTVPVCLPMETTLGLQTERRSKREKGHVTEKKRKEKKCVPGYAVPVIVVTPDDKSNSVAGDRSRKKGKKSKASKDVSINMDYGFDSNTIKNIPHSTPKKDKNVMEVTADVHVEAMQRLNSDTSIEIKDSDSFIIDLEDQDVSDMENLKIESKLQRKNVVPMTVFIDESYESCDDVSVSSRGGAGAGHPFTINSSESHHVSEV